METPASWPVAHGYRVAAHTIQYRQYIEVLTRLKNGRYELEPEPGATDSFTMGRPDQAMARMDSLWNAVPRHPGDPRTTL